MTKPTIQEAKRLIAAGSVAGLRVLGSAVANSCSQAHYNAAARVALEDKHASFSADERRLISSMISQPETDEAEGGFYGDRRSINFNFRLSHADLDRARELARREGVSVSELVRRRLLAE